MEELIPLILFVIFSILSAVGKARSNKKKKKQPTAQRRKGLVERFITWVFALQKRIEEQSKKNPKGELDWEDLLGRSKPQRPDARPPGEAHQDTDLNPFKGTYSPPPKARPAARSTSPYEARQQLDKKDMEAADTPRVNLKAKKNSMGILPTSRADLRQAIVWSEIIGPPVALRDPFGDHR